MRYLIIDERAESNVNFQSLNSHLFLVQEEVEEVEQKVADAEHSRSYARHFFTNFCTPIFLEAFVLTFLAGGLALHTAASRLYNHHGSDD